MCVCVCALVCVSLADGHSLWLTGSLTYPPPAPTTTTGIQPPSTTHSPLHPFFSSSSSSSPTSDSQCQYPVTLSKWSHSYPPPPPTISTATTTLLLLHPFSPSHIHICTHNLRSQTCPVLSPRLSQPLSRAQALLGKRGQASPNRMLMMSLTSGLQGRGEKWLWKAKITSLFHSLITYLALEMHAGASLRQACVQTIK